jgi:SAM-dependent MidA family methyltransferase
MIGPTGGLRPLSDSDFDLAAGLGDEQENGALREMICAEIRAAGPITFRRFMELALYHPTDGYYSAARPRIGRAGDYVTSPEVSPLFGYALARQLAEFWAALERPASFSLVEAGAGSGLLARDVLRWLRANAPDCYAAVRYTLVERSRTLRAAEAELLAAELREGRAQLQSALPADPAAIGCVFANELLDALPVHRVTVGDAQLREIYVDDGEHGFFERTGPPSTPALEEYFERVKARPAEGCFAEVCLETSSWLAAAAGALGRGYVLLLDYGYTAARKYAAWRRTGTLVSYHRHQAGADPYRLVGRQDLTAHVDFTSVAADAPAAGFDPLALTSQARFLAALGIGASVRLPTGGQAAVQEYYARRRAVAALLDPDGLGRISVILLGKDAPHCRYSGFSDGSDARGW